MNIRKLNLSFLGVQHAGGIFGEIPTGDFLGEQNGGSFLEMFGKEINK